MFLVYVYAELFHAQQDQKWQSKTVKTQDVPGAEADVMWNEKLEWVYLVLCTGGSFGAGVLLSSIFSVCIFLLDVFSFPLSLRYLLPLLFCPPFRTVILL